MSGGAENVHHRHQCTTHKSENCLGNTQSPTEPEWDSGKPKVKQAPSQPTPGQQLILFAHRPLESKKDDSHAQMILANHEQYTKLTACHPEFSPQQQHSSLATSSPHWFSRTSTTIRRSSLDTRYNPQRTQKCESCESHTVI